ELDVAEVGALETTPFHHPEEELRMGGAAADSTGLLLVDVGSEHASRILGGLGMAQDPGEQLGEVAHVDFPLLLEVREEVLERDASLGKPGPRPVVLAVEDAKDAFLQHLPTLAAVDTRGEELAEPVQNRTR